MKDFNDVTTWKLNQKLEKYEFKNNVFMEKYDLKNKQIAMNIIKNNDFLQYHYFSQQYGVVQSSSFIYLFYIKFNNIKMYIGFASFNSPTLNKKLRNIYFGKHFLKTMFFENKSENNLENNYKSFVLSRLVLLPSYRGLGLSTFLLESMTTNMRQHASYIEMFSNMFHNYYFAGYEFDTTFIKLKQMLTIDEYSQFFAGFKNPEKVRGFKGKSKYIANMVFDFKHDEIFKNIMFKKYGFMIDYDTEFELNKIKILWAVENQIPIILLKYFDFNEIKINKKQIQKNEHIYLTQFKNQHEDFLKW